MKIAKYLRNALAGKRPSLAPDFVFEKADGEVALMEAKGSFTGPNSDNPPVKGDLQRALQQLDAWSSVIAPTPTASFGIGTYLREYGDQNDDPSLIAMVDPPPRGEGEFDPVPLPPDLVRRCNYGAWLIGMGLVAAGTALRELREKPVEPVQLPVVQLRGRKFAFTIAGWMPPDIVGGPLLGIWPCYWPVHEFPDGRFLVSGISVEILRRLERAIRHPLKPVLREQLPLEGGELAFGAAGDESWSIMPDGSLLGMIYPGKFEIEVFKL